MKHQESPTWATYTKSFTIKQTTAHEPDYSTKPYLTSISEMTLRKQSSAAQKPDTIAISGFSGKLWCQMINWCKLSLRKSAQKDPPCPSKIP